MLIQTHFSQQNFPRLSNLSKVLKVRGPCDFSKKFQAKLNKISEISIKRMKNIDRNEQISMVLHRYLRVTQHFLAFYKSRFSKIPANTPQTHFYYIRVAELELEKHLENRISQLKQRSRSWDGLQLNGDALGNHIPFCIIR